MDSLGERLKISREGQNLTIDQIARDTRISKRYLEALEGEDFSIFPGEAYLIGFLRNYADYLELDSAEVVGLYKNIKLQEQPIPMDELIHGKKKTSPVLIFLGALAVVVVLSAGGYFLYRSIRSGVLAEAADLESDSITPKKAEFIFTGESETRWFNQGDIIKVDLGERRYSLEITAIDDNVLLTVPGGTVQLELSEARFIDLNLDTKNDLKLVFNDIDNIQADKKVNLWLIKAAALMMAEKNAAAAAEDNSESKPPQQVGSAESPVAALSDTRTVILESDSPYTFTVKIDFRGHCLLRYLVDGTARDQRFFQKAESFTLDNAKTEAKLWISNAGVVEVNVEGRPLSFGRSGQVVTRIIRWVKNDESGKHELEAVADF